MANLKVTLVKSTIGAVPKHKKTVEALGLKKLNKTVELPDNAATRGMVQQVRHLVIKKPAEMGIFQSACNIAHTLPFTRGNIALPKIQMMSSRIELTVERP